MKKFLLGLAAISTFGFASVVMAGSGAGWGYTGNTGPDYWGDLADAYKICKTGKNQSPIDIQSYLKTPDASPIAFSYNTSPTAILNNGHTIQVNVASGSGIHVEGKYFELKQYHFHTPSENLIDGQSFPMEVHFVHADSAGNLAVIGVMFELSGVNPELAELWQHMPQNAGDQNLLSGVASNLINLMPTDQSFYRFNGSLTTPPCSEGVRWFVMKNAVQVSADQVEQFLDVMHHPNNRPVQPINARIIFE